jgi:hypothetical protein
MSLNWRKCPSLVSAATTHVPVLVSVCVPLCVRVPLGVALEEGV